jgi:nucleoside phosphorylase
MTSFPRLPYEEYTVACICPMGVELTAVRAMLNEPKHQTLPTPDRNAYTLGRMGQHNIVIAVLPKTGTSSATAAGVQLLNDFKSIRFGLLVGIGGGVPSEDADIRLGDVVVSKPTGTSGGVIQFDRGKALPNNEFKRTGSLNEPPPVLSGNVQTLISDHEMKGNSIPRFLSEARMRFPLLKDKFTYPGTDNDQLFDHQRQVVERSPRHQPETPRIHYGIIGSSNQVMKDGTTRDQLKEDGILCVEMEAAGLMDNFPCLVIRGIADYADSYKNDRWHSYAAATAAAYARDLLEIIPE